MKAIDLHIHTISTILDSDFSFDLDKLKEYIECENISCIAITNHNLFDEDNYNLISKEIKVPALPGIEVSLEKGHILVIGNVSDIEKLKEQSKKMRQYITDVNSFVTYDEFLSIFSNYKDYLLIPHYVKNPVIPNEIINRFGNEIIVGEVSSAKKWFSLMKQEDKLTPVLFSDIRIKPELKNFPGTHLFVDCEDFTIGGLKNTFRDKTKISLSNNIDDNEFQVTATGTTASLGLNVLIGKRSTGKTYLLNKIYKSFGVDSVKYIQQFSIIKNAEENEFKKRLELDNSEYSDNYLKELKDIIDVAFKIDLQAENSSLNSYLDSLLDFASKQDKMDIFSKCNLFNANPFEIESDEELINNINSVDTLLSSKNYFDIISKYIDIENLKKLLLELIDMYRKKMLNDLNYQYVNDVIKIIKDELEEKSALNQVKEFNIIKYATCKKFVENFDCCLEQMKKEKEISKNDFYKFKVRAIRKPYTSVQKIKSKIKGCPKISEEFQLYNEPYNYINALLNAGVAKNQIYKSIVDVEYTALNNNNSEISGGERAEYLLYNQIKSGENYDLILIDEPESSFDNIYLNENIKSLINNISKKTTTFVVTHNHILGVMLNADKILYTCIEDGKYKIYTGKISSKNFKCDDGSEKKTTDIIMETMEAGKNSYCERSKIYENFEN